MSADNGVYFTLDPNWCFRTINCLPPRPPQKIFVDDVVVGYRHEQKEGQEYVTAIGKDPEIQSLLNEWWAEHVAEQERKAKEIRDRFFAECEERDRKALADARMAVFGRSLLKKNKDFRWD